MQAKKRLRPQQVLINSSSRLKNSEKCQLGILVKISLKTLTQSVK